jgi:hypothetical protein
MWVGIDGMANGSLVQIGTLATCRLGNGQVLHSAFLETYDKGVTSGNVTLSDMPVSPGDHIYARVSLKNPDASSHVYPLSLYNQTKDIYRVYERTVPHSSNDTSTEWDSTGTTRSATSISRPRSHVAAKGRSRTHSPSRPQFLPPAVLGSDSSITGHAW